MPTDPDHEASLRPSDRQPPVRFVHARPARSYADAMARLIVGAVVGAALVPGIASASAASRYGVLYEADGVAETYAFCTPCHSERLVAQQGLSREGWDELFGWMVDEQGMAEIPEPARTRILDYLARNYGEDRPHFPGP